MNTLVIVLIAAVVLFGAYMVYDRWLAKKWGIDPKAETPAVKYNDGKDFVPTNWLDSFQSSVLINCRSRSCNRCYSGSSIWMVTSFTLDPHRWCILRCCTGLRCTLCFS